jgi:hypothetical protein
VRDARLERAQRGRILAAGEPLGVGARRRGEQAEVAP